MTSRRNLTIFAVLVRGFEEGRHYRSQVELFYFSSEDRPRRNTRGCIVVQRSFDFQKALALDLFNALLKSGHILQ